MNIILLHDLGSPRTQQFVHTASVLKIQSGPLSLRMQMISGRSTYIYSYLPQFITSCFLSVDLIFVSTARNKTTCSQISTSRRSFFRRPIHRHGKWLSNRSRTESTKYVVPHFGHCVQEIRSHDVTFLIYSDNVVRRG